MSRTFRNTVQILVPEPTSGWTRVWRREVVSVDIDTPPYFAGRFLTRSNETVDSASVIVGLDSKDDGQGMIRVWQAVQENSNDKLGGLHPAIFEWRGRPEQWPSMLKQVRGIVQRAIAMGDIPEALQPALPGIVESILALQGIKIENLEDFNFLTQDNPRATEAFLTAIDILNRLDDFCLNVHGTGLHSLVEDEE